MSELTKEVGKVVERHIFDRAYKAGKTAGVQQVQSYLCRKHIEAMRAGLATSEWGDALEIVDAYFGEPNHLDGVNIVTAHKENK